MEKLTIVGAVLFLAVCVVCACLEKKVTAPYKWFHVYGRFKAYIALDITAVGLMLIIVGIFQPAFMEGTNDVFKSPTLEVLGGLIILIPGLLIYILTVLKCPAFLRGRCIISMLVTGFGVMMKICLFFLVFLWKLDAPEYTTLSDGKTYMIYQGDVYTPDGVCVGRRTGYGEYTVRKDEHGNPVRM